MTADRPQDEDGTSCPERDAMVATLLGITPERLRTMRRVQRKRSGTGRPGVRGDAEARWQRVDHLDDEILFATFRQREVRARAGIAAPIGQTSRRSLGLR